MTQTDNSLEAKFDILARDSGFKGSQELLINLKIQPLDIGKVMHNEYALLVSCSVKADSNESVLSKLQKTKTQASSWLREALITLENDKGLLVDGYLVLILEGGITEDIKEEARKIELDTSVCRKHVVWQSSDYTYNNLQFITSLNLPASPTANVILQPHLDLNDEARFALEAYEELGSAEKVFELIKGQNHANK